MKAPINVFGVPNPLPDTMEGSYHIRDWLRVPLFSCTLEIDDTSIVGPKLPIILSKTNELIAKSYYNGSSGVTPVSGSAKHFVLTIKNGSLSALIGIAFIDRSDAIDFSFSLHEFARRYLEPKEVKHPRRDRSRLVDPPRSSATAQPLPPPTLNIPPQPPSQASSLDGNNSDDDDDDDEFGDFQ